MIKLVQKQERDTTRLVLCGGFVFVSNNSSSNWSNSSNRNRGRPMG